METIQATAVVCTADRQISMRDVSLPAPGEGEIAIKALRSGVSVGTEFALMRGKISWGPFPICTGYMGVGVVEALGAGVDGFAPGDRVYYRGSRNMALPDGSAVSAVSGVHCSHAVSPVGGTHGAAKLPEGVDLDAASLFVMPAVGLHGVDKSEARAGETVLVHGCGPIGLGVVAMLVQRGCRVVAADIDGFRLDAGRAFGAFAAIKGGDGLAGRASVFFPAGADGFDAVFECTGIPSLVLPCIRLCRLHGSFVWQGNYGAAPFDFFFLESHNRQLTMRFPCDDGYAPCREAVLRQMASGILPWGKTVTHRVKAAEAAEFFTAVDRGQIKNLIAAVVDWEA